MSKRPPRKGEGRPTKYRPEMIQMIDDYLEKCVDEETEFHKTRGEKSDTFERVLTVRLPKIEDLVLVLGVNEDTLYEWASIHDEFSEALSKVKKLQHQKLVENALAGKYNPLIAKLMLSSNHGYKERTDQTTNDKELPQPLLYALRNNNSNPKDRKSQ